MPKRKDIGSDLRGGTTHRSGKVIVVHVRLYLKIHRSKNERKALELKEGALWGKMSHLSDGLLISLQKMGDELFPRKDGKIVTSDVDYVDVWRVRRYRLYACLNNSTE